MVGGTRYNFMEMLLCVDLCTPSGTVGGVVFVAGVDFVVRLL